MTLDYASFLSNTSKARKYSAIRALQKYLGKPGMVNLGGGLPNPSSFPFASLSVTLQDGTIIEIPKQDLQSSLQYGQTKGEKRLTDWIIQLQQRVHAPPVEFDVCVGHGSQDLMTKAMEMLLNPDTDTILLESPTYVGILAFLRPFGVGLQEISIDAEGISAEELDRVLDNWESTHPASKKKPRVLYTVATASNPTGITTSLKRKQQVYAVAQKHNLIILEDDPYYYLQYNQTPNSSASNSITSHLTPSYFSMDSDARVLRFDSFSKILSAGARLGFVSGPPLLIDRLQMHQQSTILSPSGLSQLLLTTYLQEKGVEGFLAHCAGPTVAGLYKGRRDVFMEILEKYMGGKGITWTVPNAGMFCWIDLSGVGVTDSFNLISEKCIEAGVTLVPGQEFYADNRVTSFVRASFSYSSHQDMELGIQRLASLLGLL